MIDHYFLQALRDIYGATIVEIDSHTLIIKASSRLPTNLEQLAYSINIEVIHEGISISGYIKPDNYIVANQIITYTYLVSSLDFFCNILSKEIDAKKYLEFSKVFDSEVELELDKKKD